MTHLTNSPTLDPSAAANALKLLLAACAIGGAPLVANGQCPMSFEPGVSTATGLNPYAIAVGDLNGDGIPDVAVANYSDGPGAGSVSVFLSTGHGGMAPPEQYSAGGGPHAVAIADVDGDLIPDLVVANFRSGSVSLLLGNPAPARGTFTPAVDLPAGAGASGVVAADFNGDGHMDLAVSLWNGTEARVLLGRGGGVFDPAVGYPVASNANAIAVDDLDHDGHADLVVACYSANSLSLLRGLGDGTFMDATTLPAGQNPAGLALGDLNGDGWSDIVVSDIAESEIGDSRVSVLLNAPGGVLSSAPACRVGAQPQSVAIADFNHDGRPDLVAAIWSTNEAMVMVGNGDGTFQPAVGVAAGPNPTGICSGDFDTDGRQDIAVASWSSNSVTLLRNDSTFVTQEPSPFATCPSGGATFSVAVSEAHLSFRWQREVAPDSGRWENLSNGSSAGWDCRRAADRRRVPACR